MLSEKFVVIHEKSYVFVHGLFVQVNIEEKTTTFCVFENCIPKTSHIFSIEFNPRKFLCFSVRVLFVQVIDEQKTNRVFLFCNYIFALFNIKHITLTLYRHTILVCGSICRIYWSQRKKNNYNVLF